MLLLLAVAAVLPRSVDSTLHLESHRSRTISGTYVRGILPPSLGGASSPYLVHATHPEAEASRDGHTDLYLYHDGEGGRWYIGETLDYRHGALAFVDSFSVVFLILTCLL